MKLRNTQKWLMPALAILASAGQALAVSFSGSTTGVFANPVGGVSSITNGGTTFNWGTSIAGNPTSQLDFAGADFGPVACDQEFQIGTVTYFNGSVARGSSSSAVELLINIAFTTPAGLVDLTYLLTLNSTPDLGLPGGVPDTVVLPHIPTQSFTLDGQNYEISLDFDGVHEFSVAEGQTDSVGLTATIACVPESGSSLALLGGGMLLVSGLRRKLKANK